MKKICSVFIVMSFFILATVFYAGCAHNKAKNNSSQYPEGILINKPYDEVWEAVKEFVLVDIGCSEKDSNKKKGSIETDWVTQITTEGTLRWKITAELKQTDNGIRLFIDKDVDMRELAGKGSRLKERSKDDHPNAGWKRTNISETELDRLYQRLENKLR